MSSAGQSQAPENGHDRQRLRQQIDENLGRVYQDALNQPLPQRFAELLDELRRKERRE
ncbi:MAG: NepR family anti-sigma factor [Gemmobacter sp.]